MTAPSLEEVWAKLVDVWRADTPLMSLLGESGGIYRDYPARAPKLPSLILEVNGLNPKPSTGYGIFNPSLQLSVYATDQDLGAAIYVELQERWQIPAQRAAELLTTNYRITMLSLSNPILIGPYRSDEYGDNVFHFVMQCQLKVQRRAA